MTRRRRARFFSTLAITTLIASSGCTASELRAFCEIFGLTVPAELQARDGETLIIDLYLVRGDPCVSPGSLTATSNNPAALEFGGFTVMEISPSQAPAGVPLPRNSDEDLLHFSLPVKLNLAGSHTAQLRYTNPDANVDEVRPISIISQAARGAINVQITGLPAGVPADVYVDIEGDEVHFTASGSAKFFFGEVEWEAFPVTGPDGTVYVPMPAFGVVPLAINETKTLNIVYAADAPAMGWLNLQISGLFGGATGGGVRVMGDGFNQVFTQSGMVELRAGAYLLESSTASTTNNDFNDPQPMREVMVTAGQTTNALFAYAIIATLVNINVFGLEAGLAPLITFTRGLETRTVSANTAAIKLAIGLWTIAMLDRTASIRTYTRTGSAATSINVLALTSPMALALAYYCSRFQWQIASTWGIFSDPFSHAGFIQMLLVAHVLNILWQFPDPAPAVPSGSTVRANQTVTQETVTITGQGAFVQVTGTRGANGALNLTGSGTVAGFSNVPVAMTGTLTNAGALTGVQYRMGQTEAPTGLPNGPIIYTVTAPAPPPGPPPGFDLFGFAALARR